MPKPKATSLPLADLENSTVSPFPTLVIFVSQDIFSILPNASNVEPRGIKGAMPGGAGLLIPSGGTDTDIDGFARVGGSRSRR